MGEISNAHLYYIRQVLPMCDALPAEWRALMHDFDVANVFDLYDMGFSPEAARRTLQARLDANDPSRNGEWK